MSLNTKKLTKNDAAKLKAENKKFSLIAFKYIAFERCLWQERIQGAEVLPWVEEHHKAI